MERGHLVRRLPQAPNEFLLTRSARGRGSQDVRAPLTFNYVLSSIIYQKRRRPKNWTLEFAPAVVRRR